VLADALGFVFDLDGTLVQRSPAGVVAMPEAATVIAAIRRSQRPLVVFTNASHVAPARIAAELREAGLDIRDGEVLTPVCTALSHLARRHRGARVFVVGTADAKRQFDGAGVHRVEREHGAQATAVFVAHADEVEFADLEAAAGALRSGAAFLTANYAPVYAGRDGPIFSRGAMLTAALAKASGRRPTIVGKPSRIAVREVSARLAVASSAVAVIGDDLEMDIALGRIGGSMTVLVRSGISGSAAHRAVGSVKADMVVDGVADLLPMLQ
jgi:HAD superfamily hydrolase (TIGR01450 family)